MSVRLATSEDIAALGFVLPAWSVRWGGWVYPATDTPKAIGYICWDAKGQAYCFFSGEAPPIVMHRLATRAIRWLCETNAERILSACDDTKPRAREWLYRLGFRPTEVDIPDFNTKIWECER